MTIKSKHIAIALAVTVVLFTMWVIYKQIEEYKLQDDPMLKKIRAKIEPLFTENYDFNSDSEIERLLSEKGNIFNHINLYRGNKSYTINKQKIFLCLRDEHGEYYNLNLLIYVTLHEIAHTLCPEIGHTKLFDHIFNMLLVKAAEMDIYDPTAYIDPNYCTFSSDKD